MIMTRIPQARSGPIRQASRLMLPLRPLAAVLACAVMGLALSGCESRQVRPGAAPVVDIDSSAPFSAGSGELVGSALRVGLADGGIDYRARVRVESEVLGQVAGAGANDSVKVPGELGRQSLEQQLQSTLPMPFGSPLRLGVESRQAVRYGIEGQKNLVERNTARLDWSGNHLQLAFDWRSRNENAGRGTDCYIGGEARLPVTALPGMRNSALVVNQRHCAVSGAGLAGASVSLDDLAAAWRWGGELENGLRVRRLQPENPGTDQTMPGEPDYELGLTQRLLTFAGWQAEADIALRRVAFRPNQATADVQEDNTWVADFGLRRGLALLDLNARWTRSADPLWFLIGPQPAVLERFAVGLDFGRWLRQLWPGSDSRMNVSMGHEQRAGGVSDQHFNWNLLLNW